MGDRAQVKFMADGEEVWFYTHWKGSELEKTVKSAMKRGEDRLSDSSYLARIIFSEMIKDSVMDTIGYGIDFEQHGDVDRVITVNCDRNTVTDFSGNQFSFSEYTK